MSIDLKRTINRLTNEINGRVDQINGLDAMIDVKNDRIEELENEIAKLISILDKIASGFDYPREHILAIVDRSKFIYQKGE